MFPEEAKALKYLENIVPGHIPKTCHQGSYKHMAYLILEWINTTNSRKQDWDTAARVLVKMHRSHSSYFGWSSDNFIGSLPQSNTYSESWVDFYHQERLLPQVRLAGKSRYLAATDMRAFDGLFQILPDLLPECKPQLIHGDLWAGNIIFHQDGKPFYIDPAICFAHREMDIAMSRLFGGYPNRFYACYQDMYPMLADWESRIELYQLYYLLVHLNLFGRAYYGRVMSIVNSYL
jgi:fructosamine-3-kinase